MGSKQVTDGDISIKRDQIWFKITKHTNIMDLAMYSYYTTPDTFQGHPNSICQM